MRLQTQVARLTQQLTAPPMESEHFRLAYRRWCVFGSQALNAGGVRDEAILPVYLDAFEKLYDRMHTGFSWEAPRTDSSRKIHAYVLHIPDLFANDEEPLTWADRDHVPYIVLSSRSRELTRGGVFQRAASDAVHEGAHVFLEGALQECPRAASAEWEWFGDCIASYFERIVLPDNPHWLSGCRHWCDRPEISLDAPAARYSGMFVAYVVRRNGPDTLAKIWRQVASGRHPLVALDETLNPRDLATAVASSPPDPEYCRMFGDYCADGYFVGDPASPAFAPEVAQRFGQRTSVECLDVVKGRRSTLDGVRLARLSCRYVTLRLHASITSATIAVRTSAAGASNLRVFAAVAGHDLTRVHQTELTIQDAGAAEAPPADPENATKTFRGSLSGADAHTMHHIVVTIAHCGVRDREVRTCTLEVEAAD